MALGSVAIRPWFVGVGVAIVVVSFDWNLSTERVWNVRSDCVGFDVLWLDAVCTCGITSCSPNRLWGDGSRWVGHRTWARMVLWLAVAGMGGNRRHRLNH